MPRPHSSAFAPGLFALLCLAWGSGWLALKLGVAAVPPIFFAGSRFVAAGSVLLLWLVARGKIQELKRLPMRTLVPGTLLMISVNYGLMAWGVTRVTSGVAAVVNLTTIPLAMTCFGVVFGQARWSWRKTVGLIIGSGGLATLFLPALLAAPVQSSVALYPAASSALGLLAIASGAACYAWGSVLTRGHLAGAPPLVLSTLQALLGGGVLIATSAFIEPWSAFSTPTALVEILVPTHLGGWGFLVAISVVSTPAYLALLARWEPSRVAAYAYICPAIAIAEGVVFGGESLTLAEAGGALLLAASAVLVLGAPKLTTAAASIVTAPPEGSASSVPHPRPGGSL